MDWSKKEQYQKYTYDPYRNIYATETSADSDPGPKTPQIKILTVQLSSNSRVGIVPVNDPCPETTRNIEKQKGGMIVLLWTGRGQNGGVSKNLCCVGFALHSLGPVDVLADLFAVGLESDCSNVIADKSWKRTQQKEMH